MSQYFIENNEIIISFDSAPATAIRDELKTDRRFNWDKERSVWHGAHTPENEALARKVTGAIPADIRLEERLQMCMENPKTDAKAKLTESLMESVDVHLDEYLEYIHKAVDEERKIEEEKSVYDSRKKELSAKRAIVENVVASYLNSVGEDRMKGSVYNVFVKDSYTYKLDPALERELKEKVAPLLPGWVDVVLKVRKEAEQADPKPEGVVVAKAKQTIGVWSDDEPEPGLPQKKRDLQAFLQGKTIKEISDARGVDWQAVFVNLKACMGDGTLDIHTLVSQDTLDRLVELHELNPDAKPYELVRLLGNAVSYDYVVLSLSFLGLAHR